MKGRNLLIIVTLMAALIPAYLLNKYLLRVMRPRESAQRFFLYFIACFVLIVVYTIFVVGIIVRIFPVGVIAGR